MQILIADRLPEFMTEELVQAGLDVKVRPGLTAGELPDAAGEADILVVRSTEVTAQTMDAARNLKLIIRAGAGTNTIDVETATERGIFVANTPGQNKHAVGELAIGALIAADRQIVNAATALRRGCWNKKAFGNARGLRGRILGILGLGEIGQYVARVAQEMGMTVVAWSRSLTPERADELGVIHATHPLTVARAADAVTMHLAATPETEHIIDGRFLDEMRDGAILVNTARGTLIETEALKKAIRAKGLRVSLDVFEDEPAGGTAAFHDTELAALVTATPHIGASTAEATEAVAAEVVRIVELFVATGTSINPVNAPRRPQPLHHARCQERLQPAQ